MPACLRKAGSAALCWVHYNGLCFLDFGLSSHFSLWLILALKLIYPRLGTYFPIVLTVWHSVKPRWLEGFHQDILILVSNMGLKKANKTQHDDRTRAGKKSSLMKMTSERWSKRWRSVTNASSFLSKGALFSSREFRQQLIFGLYGSDTTNVAEKRPWNRTHGPDKVQRL